MSRIASVAAVIVLAASAAAAPALKVVPLATMSAPRAAHTATLLQDGSVLLVGGCAADGCSAYGATSERFDPRSNRFSPSGSMSIGRSSHSAVLLADGRVFVSGGWTRGVVTGTSEIYDPKSGKFSSAAAMTTPRAGHTAVTLPDGRILLMGGERATQEGLDSVEIYDPERGNFHTAGNLMVPRLSHAAFVMRDGRVLVIGGRSGRGQVLATAEIYDPATGRSTPTGTLSVPRHKFGAAQLADGRIIVVGGSDRDEAGARYTSTEVYEPSQGSFGTGPELTRPRYKLDGGVVALKDGRVLVAGGADAAEVLDLAAGRSAVLSGATTGAHAFSKATTLNDGRVLLTGGYDAKLKVTRAAWIIAP
jgi:hypothetical protein